MNGAARAGMPQLSEDLAGPRDPRLCQACGAAGDVRAWQEHDARDRPAIRIVVLCRSCSKRLIGPHPRLYRPLGVNEPFPAAMGLCLDCRFRDGVNCTHWRNKATGGPGLYPGITIAAPHRAHVYLRGGQGFWVRYPRLQTVGLLARDAPRHTKRTGI